MRGLAAGQLPTIYTTPRLQGDQKLWVTQNKNRSTFVQSDKTKALHVIRAQFYDCAFIGAVSVCKSSSMSGINFLKQQKFI